MRAWVVAIVVAGLAAAPGCIADCADCGPCGFAGGPNRGDAIYSSPPGLNGDGDLVIPLEVRRDNECVAENADYAHVVYADEMLTFEDVAAEGLDTAALVDHGDGVYALSNPAITATIVKVDSRTLDITVAGADFEVGVVCSIPESDGGDISCA